MNLTSKERVQRTLDHKPVDRLPIYECFWGDTCMQWRSEGHIRQDEDIIDHFDLDLSGGGWPNTTADLDFQEQVLEETDEWKITLSGNGAKLKWWKHQSGTPEHVDFLVKDRTGWERHIKPRLLDEKVLMRRIPFDEYRNAKRAAKEHNRFFCWWGVNVFELMHPVCGHEYMLIGMAEDPDWIKDMAQTYSDLDIKIQQILFEKEGKPDGIWYYEDMGFKNRPFMSPAMYRELIQPYHKNTFDYAHSIGCKVVLHSCGFVEPLLPGLVEAGIDCLQAMEVKAGMDLLRIKKNFGDKIALMGGLDIRVLETNDKAKIDQLLEEKLPAATTGSGYIVHSDHSIPPSVNYDTYKYFLERAKSFTML